MIQNADKRMHPAMNVTFHPNHDFRLEESARDRRIARALTVIPFAIDFSHRVDVVRYRVRVDDFQDLSRSECPAPADETSSHFDRW